MRAPARAECRRPAALLAVAAATLAAAAPHPVRRVRHAQPAGSTQPAALAHRRRDSFAAGRPERRPAASDGPAAGRGAVSAARATQRLRGHQPGHAAGRRRPASRQDSVGRARARRPHPGVLASRSYRPTRLGCGDLLGEPERRLRRRRLRPRPGYGIYHQPLRQLLDQQLPGRALDLTGHPFTDLLAQLAHRVPVLIWTTTSYAPTDNWVTWQTPTGPVRATPDEHAVLLVGYDHDNLLINDPLSGHAAIPVDTRQLQAAWQQLGAQALTVTA